MFAIIRRRGMEDVVEKLIPKFHITLGWGDSNGNDYVAVELLAFRPQLRRFITFSCKIRLPRKVGDAMISVAGRARAIIK